MKQGIHIKLHDIAVGWVPIVTRAFTEQKLS